MFTEMQENNFSLIIPVKRRFLRWRLTKSSPFQRSHGPLQRSEIDTTPVSIEEWSGAAALDVLLNSALRLNPVLDLAAPSYVAAGKLT